MKIYTEKEVKEAKVISMALGVLSSERHDVVRKFIKSVVTFLKTVFVKLNAKIISNKKRSKSKRSLREGDQIAAITL